MAQLQIEYTILNIRVKTKTVTCSFVTASCSNRGVVAVDTAGAEGAPILVDDVVEADAPRAASRLEAMSSREGGWVSSASMLLREKLSPPVDGASL